MDILALIALGAAAGAGAGLLAGLIGIGGGIVVVPVVYYGLLSSGVPPYEAVHVAVANVSSGNPASSHRVVSGASAGG